MLQENGSTISPATDPGPPLKQEPKINRGVLLVSIAVALLCAATVFFVLFRHDTAQLAPVAIPQASAPQNTAPASKPHDTTPSPQAAASAPSTEPVAPEPAQVVKPGEPQRVRFLLRRSGGFQTFGPLKLKLLSTTPRRGTCQIAMMAGGDHSRSRSVLLNRTIQVQSEKGASIDLVVNGMTKDVVRGSVVAHEPPPEQ